MPVSRGIAQARSYEWMSNGLVYQFMGLSAIVGLKMSSWWWVLWTLIILMVLCFFPLTRFLLSLAFSLFWGWFIYQLSTELGAGWMSFVHGVIAFAIVCFINSAGMVGLLHSVPEVKNLR